MREEEGKTKPEEERGTSLREANSTSIAYLFFGTSGPGSTQWPSGRWPPDLDQSFYKKETNSPCSGSCITSDKLVALRFRAVGTLMGKGGKCNTLHFFKGREPFKQKTSNEAKSPDSQVRSRAEGQDSFAHLPGRR